MRGLVLKVFLLFWLSSAALVAIVFTVVTLTAEPRREQRAEILYGHAERAVAAYAGGGEEGLARFLDGLERGEGIRAYLLDAAGDPLARQPPRRLLRRLTRFPQVLAVDDGRPSRASVHALLVQAEDGREYRFIAVLPPSAGMFRQFGRQGPGLLLLVLATAVASLLIAWLMTRPLAQLSELTRRFADGELGVRPGPALERRGDVIGRLAREFGRMAARIEALVTAQRQLVRDVSHELRAPLARLQVAAALAARRLGERDADVARIEEEVGRLDLLLRQLIELHAVDGAATAVGHQAVDLVAVAGEVVADARYEYRDRDIELGGDSQVVVSGDRLRLHGAVENVVRNAMRHTAPGTTVSVRVSATPTAATIEVDDFGPGLAEEHLERVFEPFFRVDSARSPEDGGHGLSLAIAAAVVRAHGGEIGAANRRDGGLRVTMRLPLRSDAGRS